MNVLTDVEIQKCTDSFVDGHTKVSMALHSSHIPDYTWRARNIVREPQDQSRNEPTIDIHTEGSGQNINIQNDKYMPFVVYIVLMSHVHHLSTEMEEE